MVAPYGEAHRAPTAVAVSCSALKFSLYLFADGGRGCAERVQEARSRGLIVGEQPEQDVVDTDASIVQGQSLSQRLL